jgi:hypothetical protein
MIEILIFAQITEQLLNDSTKSTGLSVHETYMAIAVVALVTAVVTMYFDNRKIHAKSAAREREHSDQQNENIEKMTVAMTNSTHAINNNTKIVDLLYQRMENVRFTSPKKKSGG